MVLEVMMGVFNLEIKFYNNGNISSSNHEHNFIKRFYENVRDQSQLILKLQINKNFKITAC